MSNNENPASARYRAVRSDDGPAFFDYDLRGRSDFDLEYKSIPAEPGLEQILRLRESLKANVVEVTPGKPRKYTKGTIQDM